ncbi:hypothetical protein [Actinoplanes sp. DH11]|uniref:hypothetical protein n=1 Tax=Actinoplanes sp. DH11 TaxID=2857011 RepID=UPI001E5E0E40|nr:hypothetical protein [Actinoplanes sp. DH11]
MTDAGVPGGSVPPGPGGVPGDGNPGGLSGDIGVTSSGAANATNGAVAVSGVVAGGVALEPQIAGGEVGPGGRGTRVPAAEQADVAGERLVAVRTLRLWEEAAGRPSG